MNKKERDDRREELKQNICMALRKPMNTVIIPLRAGDLLAAGDLNGFMRWLKPFLQEIDQVFKADHELKYPDFALDQIIPMYKEVMAGILATFRLLALECDFSIGSRIYQRWSGDGEGLIIESAGVLDMVLATGDFIYVFEFGTDAKEALAQISGRNYRMPHLTPASRIIHVGVAIDMGTRSFGDYRFASL